MQEHRFYTCRIVYFLSLLAKLNVYFIRQPGIPIFAGVAYWQNHVEFTAGEINFVIPFALHPDSSAMRLHNTLGKSQSQPGAASFEPRFACGMLRDIARLVKLAEDNILGGGIYSDAGIADDNLNTTIR